MSEQQQQEFTSHQQQQCPIPDDSGDDFTTVKSSKTHKSKSTSQNNNNNKGRSDHNNNNNKKKKKGTTTGGQQQNDELATTTTTVSGTKEKKHQKRRNNTGGNNKSSEGSSTSTNTAHSNNINNSKHHATRERGNRDGSRRGGNNGVPARDNTTNGAVRPIMKRTATTSNYQKHQNNQQLNISKTTMMKLPIDPATLETYLRLLSSVIEYECNLLRSQPEHEQDFNFHEKKLLFNVRNRLIHVYDAAALKQQNTKDIDVCISRSQIFSEMSLTEDEKFVIGKLQDKYHSAFDLDSTPELQEFTMYRDAHLLFFDLLSLCKETLYEGADEFINSHDNTNTEYTKQLLEMSGLPEDWRVLFANSDDVSMQEKWNEVNYNKMVEQQLNEAKFILTWDKFLKSNKLEDVSETNPKAMIQQIDTSEVTSPFERVAFFREHIIDQYQLSEEEARNTSVEYVEQMIWNKYLTEKLKLTTFPQEAHEQEQVLRQNDSYADRQLASKELLIVKNKIKFEWLDKDDYKIIYNKDLKTLKKKHPYIKKALKTSKKSFEGYMNNIGHLFNFLRNLFSFFPCETDSPWAEKLSYTQFVLHNVPQLLDLIPFFEKKMYFWRRTQRDMRYTLQPCLEYLKLEYLGYDQVPDDMMMMTGAEQADDLEEQIKAQYLHAETLSNEIANDHWEVQEHQEEKQYSTPSPDEEQLQPQQPASQDSISQGVTHDITTESPASTAQQEQVVLRDPYPQKMLGVFACIIALLSFIIYYMVRQGNLQH